MTPETASNRWRGYAVGLGLQTVGAVLLLAGVLPRYRELIKDPQGLGEGFWKLAASLGCIVLMQAGYWPTRALAPPAPRAGKPLFGQVIRFVGRAVFMFVTSLFSFLFITRVHGMDLPLGFATVAVLGLFSLYCFTDHLERLGGAVAAGRTSVGTQRES